MAPAKAKKTSGQKRKKLDKKADGYFAHIGRLGGIRTKKNKGEKFFAEIAKISHLNRGNSAISAPEQAESDPPARTRKPAGSRSK